jgi:hypothetical protein
MAPVPPTVASERGTVAGAAVVVVVQQTQFGLYLDCSFAPRTPSVPERAAAEPAGEQFSGGTPGRRPSPPTYRMPHQPFIDPAGTFLPVPGWVEGSIR